jgi:hypothetical protein
MSKVGIAAAVWKDTESMSGFAPTPALAGYLAEVFEVKTGHSDKDGNEYVMPGMVMAHDDLEQGEVKHWQYFTISEERVGFLKAFLEKIGRCDLMREDADWDELIGTQFECDVTQSKSKKDGKVYSNIETHSIKAVSHDFFEPVEYEEEPEDAVDEIAEEEPEPPKIVKRRKATAQTKATPRRSPRAQVQR